MNSDSFENILAARAARRGFFKGGIAIAASSFATGGALAKKSSTTPPSPRAGGAKFDSLNPQSRDDLEIAGGHRVAMTLSWQDPINHRETFGFNCDFTGFIERDGQALLTVNHEYIQRYLFHPDFKLGEATQEQVDEEMRAHGMSIVGLKRTAKGQWEPDLRCALNRRIDATTPILLSGPAAGHSLTKTTADPQGYLVLGTLNNCSGGKTPWGTVLSGEENTHNYFINRGHLPEGEVRDLHERYQLPEENLFHVANKDIHWGEYDPRFDVAQEPNEAFRFGWVLELDPFDPTWIPRKRTALGRFRHEAATCIRARSGKVVVYSGDDCPFEHAYKFVSDGVYDPADAKAARDAHLLEDGILYAAKFNADGTGEWLPLIHGQNGLKGSVEVEGKTYTFNDQGDVVIKTRIAASFLGATKMDRAEDIEASPVTGKVYMALTNNPGRGVDGNPTSDPANPRDSNCSGHIIEIIEDGANHDATRFRWEILLLCGDPEDPETHFAGFPKDQLPISGIAAPDNLTFDADGNLWIATDGLKYTPGLEDRNDGLFRMVLEGEERGYISQFLSAPKGAEIAGPEFTPDGETLFVSIQHPGDGKEASYHQPSSRWPDFEENTPAKPSVVAIQRDDGQRIS